MSKANFYSLDRAVLGSGLLLIVVFIAPLSLGRSTYSEEESSEPSLRTRLAQLPDSFQLGNITVYSLFKDQILANEDGAVDSQRVVDKVYHRHRILWEECYGMIFGPENAPRFLSDSGMIAWNQSLYAENEVQLDSLAKLLLGQNVDSIFTSHAARFKELDYTMPSARISLAFTPLFGPGFGSCSNDQFVLELNNPEYDIPYAVSKGIPHEIYHLINTEQSPQPAEFTALDLTLTEGLACYFTYVYFGGAMPKHEAVEAMTAEEWRYYVNREVEIYEKLSPYFEDTSGDNPLLNGGEEEFFPDAPKSLYYWLGFRIVEQYLKIHPEANIRDLTSMSYSQIFEDSKYGERIVALAEAK